MRTGRQPPCRGGVPPLPFTLIAPAAAIVMMSAEISRRANRMITVCLSGTGDRLIFDDVFPTETTNGGPMGRRSGANKNRTCDLILIRDAL